MKMMKVFIAFFDIKGIFYFESIPQDQTFNQAYYVDMLKRLREAVRRRRPGLWLNDSIPHHDNAPAHKALSSRFWPKN
jgi:hypothetical protein